MRKQCKVVLKLRYKPSQRVVLPLKGCVLVRLEFEIKLEPLLLPNATAAAATTAPTAPTLF